MSQSEERAAMRALVEALPRCAVCGAPTTVGVSGHIDVDVDCPSAGSCDVHADRDAPRGYASDQDLPYAEPLRTMLKMMATWPEETKDADGSE